MSFCCPMCSGSGVITPPRNAQKMMDKKRIAAQLLKDEGYSIREIMRLLHYKSPRSVQVLLIQHHE